MFKDHCRCCREEKLTTYLKLGNQPLANSYHKGEKLTTYPLNVQLCENCFHSQLSIVVPPDLMFRNYLYVSGTTSTFRKHCQDLATDAVCRSGVQHPKVLDIACNDGTLLECFRSLGCKVYGVDPAENLRKFTRNKEIDVKVAYWSQETAKSFSNVDIITATNVFAHVDDVHDFLYSCAMSLAADGTVILEFPCCDELIDRSEFDTIYHEHLSYFLMNSFKYLIERTPFYVHDVMKIGIHGGSVRLFLKKGNKENCDKFANLVSQEEKNGLLSRSTYFEFAERVDRHKKEMQDLIAESMSNKETVIGYGASAKGNTMLNYFEIDLNFIVDDNYLKWDYLTPGRNIPIKSPEEMRNYEKLSVVILAWNFYEEIAKKIESITGKKQRYIGYVPEVKSW